MPGIWHNKMEAYFPKEMTEIKFVCSSNSKETCRRADVLLNNNRTCEIQHSFISPEEITKRFNDWNLFGKEIIWLVDGNGGIDYEELSTGNYLIIFKDDWKYKSFVTTYNFILLEIDGKVFKIELKKIKCKMIELKMFITIEEVVNILKSKPENIWDNWADDNVIKCNLHIHQLGAGNGKTYGIWKSIAENVDKSDFIITTKQHSAKNVIYKELIDQSERQEYHIENLTEKIEDNTSAHYVIKYTHKITKRECKVIIGTIDSFIYNLSGSSNSDNYFEGILLNIKKNGLTKVYNGAMNFGGQYVTLNKQTDLWLDEAQDLPKLYLDAMAKLMLTTNCDIHMVGDKLQTLQYEENCMTTIINDEGLINTINYIYHEPININRRIKVPGMRQEINRVINFNKYGLPEIYNQEEELVEPTIECFKAETIYVNEKNLEKKYVYVKNIIEKVDYEVKLNNYTPENFMFIFPIMKNNAVASELHTKLTEYWIQKFNDQEYIKKINNTYWKNYQHDQYTQYTYHHKHTEGTCINTAESINASRIMSIRTSKGDGREVVFILQVTERTLKLCSDKKYGLVYDSHLHVALTRAKCKNYIALEENIDKIHKLFSNCGYVGYFPKIINTIRLNTIIDNIDKKKIMELIDLYITQPDFTLNKQNETENIDWGYHCIKRAVYYFKFISGIVNKRYDNVDFEKSELATKLSILSRLQIKVMYPSDFYEYLNKNEKNDIDVIPLCNLSDNSNYKGYFIKIKDAMKKIQKCIIGNDLDLLNVYETVILVYMITLYKNKNFCDISPVEIYNITDFFKTNSKECILFETTKNVDTIINDLLDGVEVKSIWNIQKNMKLKSSSNDFTISNNNFDLIGNDSKNITHIILSSDLNQLNFWDTMITALLERFLIYNPKSDKDCNKYNNKKINTYIFVLKLKNYEKLDWEWDKDMDIEIRKEIKKAMMIHFSENHEAIYNYFCYIKNDNTNFGKGTDYNTPFQYILSEMKKQKDSIGEPNYPAYIIKIFDELHEKLVLGCKEEVKQICSNLVNFNDMLNIKLEIACDSYLGISETSDYDF